MTAKQIIYSVLEFSLEFEVRQHALNELQARLNESPVDTRRALQGYVPNSDVYQNRVVESTETTIRMLAPAGSGKTQTVVNRVLTNIRKGLSAKRIIILTFDKAAVSSITSKLKEELARLRIEQEQMPTVSTINAFGYRILREYVPEEYKGVVPNYRSIRLLREVKDALRDKSPERLNALPHNLNEQFYIEFFSLLKNEIFDPRRPDAQMLADFMLERTETTSVLFSSASSDVVTKVIQAVIWLYMAYELALEREQLLDFDDQKLRPYLAMQEKPALLRLIQEQYAEVIVDEFQDINHLDFKLIQAIASKARLVVTGDDDQAIYGFRGCSPEYIINLEAHLGRKVSSYELSMNYRCPPNIVEHADRLIRHNTFRVNKKPIAQRKEPAAIKVVSTLSAGLEAKIVMSYIRRVMQATPGLHYKDFVILYRTNAQSLPLQVEFILNNLPYYVRDEDNILQNKILERLLATLRVKLHLGARQQPTPIDAVALIQSYFAYITPEQSESLLKLLSQGRRVLDTLNSEAFYQILPKARSSNLIPSVQALTRAKSLMDELDILSKSFKGLTGIIGSLEDVMAERVPLGEIYELAANFEGKTRDFVQTLETALERARQTKAGTNRDSGIGLLTYFRAKGLQWHTVILTTCNEGLIPHKRAPIEDERRLFYVAMTRASSNLFISYVKNSCNNSVVPSRFLNEAGLL